MPSHAHLVVDINQESFQREQNKVQQAVGEQAPSTFHSGGQAAESSEQPNDVSHRIVKEILESTQKDTSLYAALTFLCDKKLLRYESFNHIIHDEKELNRIVLYILQNPVKANLVNNWREWRWSFVSDEIKYAADASCSERIY
jgi:translation elongation factor EF-Ts